MLVSLPSSFQMQHTGRPVGRKAMPVMQQQAPRDGDPDHETREASLGSKFGGAVRAFSRISAALLMTAPLIMQPAVDQNQSAIPPVAFLMHRTNVSH